MPTGIYVAHRENQREWILEVAEDLFINKGIEQVTMGDIAIETKLARATIYKYFSTKEQVAGEIFKLTTRAWRDRNEREVWGFRGTGYQRLERFIESFFGQLFDHPREASFVAEFNYLYGKALEAETFANRMLENLAEDHRFVENCVKEGIADKSLNGDIEPALVVAAFFNFLSGMISRLGEMGPKVDKEFGFTSRTIFTQIGRYFLEGLRAR